jgi:hypothetical protein
VSGEWWYWLAESHAVVDVEADRMAKEAQEIAREEEEEAAKVEQARINREANAGRRKHQERSFGVLIPAMSQLGELVASSAKSYPQQADERSGPTFDGVPRLSE